MEQKERYTKARPKRSGRGGRSKPANQEKDELIEQLKLLNYNLLSIGLILGGSLRSMACSANPLNPMNDILAKRVSCNIDKMKEVNAKMGGVACLNTE